MFPIYFVKFIEFSKSDNVSFEVIIQYVLSTDTERINIWWTPCAEGAAITNLTEIHQLIYSRNITESEAQDDPSGRAV